MKQSILNFTIRHFKISVPSLRHRIILLQDSIPRHSMMGHVQAPCIQPELFPIQISCLYTIKKVLISWMFVLKNEVQETALQWFLYWYQLNTQFLYKLHKIKFLYMFRASSAHLQEVSDVNCTCMQPLLFSFCKSELLLYCTWNMLSLIIIDM